MTGGNRVGGKRRFYACIGDQRTPQDAIDRLVGYAKRLRPAGYIVRTSGEGTVARVVGRTVGGMRQTFRPMDHIPKWAFDEMSHLIYLGEMTLRRRGSFAAREIARMALVMLGSDSTSPVDFVLCWTPSREAAEDNIKMALRLAAHHGIPTFNIRSATGRKDLDAWMNNHLDGGGKR